MKQRARAGLIGRDDELTAVRAELHEQPLVTLTGPGGCGKTRLALAIADLEGERCSNGVSVVELAPLTDPALVPQAVGTALGLREQSDRPLDEALAEAIADRHELLLLDNCEHLLVACAALVERLVQRCPNLRVLATSRTPLGAPGERTWQVQPLSQPHAVQLFVERAQAVRRTFAMTADNTSAIRELCRRLDGLPLAIELAAAQTRVLGVAEIAQRLDRLLDVATPTTSRHDASSASNTRQRSLRAAIDWSFLMLSAADQVVFTRLAVFADGWSVAAAETVCSADLAALTRLVDQSLVVVEERRGTARHHSLEVIRQYAAERLTASGTAQLVAERHARYFAQLAEQSAAGLTSYDPGRAMATFQTDHDNFRAALAWLVEHAPNDALRVAGAMWWFWFRAGAWREGRRWIERVLALGGDTVSGSVAQARARALLGLGALAWAQGDHGLATTTLGKSIALLRDRGDSEDLGLALQFQAMELLGAGNLGQAQALADESVALLRHSPRPLAVRDADQPSLPRATPGPVALALALASRGVVWLAMSDYEAARAPLDESVELLRAAHDHWALALPLRNLGIAALLSGHPGTAASLLCESLHTLQAQPDPWFVSRSVETLAVVTAAQGQFARAARLFGAGEGLRAAVGAAVLPFYRSDYERAFAATREALGEVAFAAAVREGRAMRIDEALAFALAAGSEPPGALLSPREREVLALLARGVSNRAIAEQLVITEKTAEAHVSAILRKLNLSSRAQVAAWAAAHAREP